MLARAGTKHRSLHIHLAEDLLFFNSLPLSSSRNLDHCTKQRGEEEEEKKKTLMEDLY